MSQWDITMGIIPNKPTSHKWLHQFHWYSRHQPGFGVASYASTVADSIVVTATDLSSVSRAASTTSPMSPRDPNTTAATARPACPGRTFRADYCLWANFVAPKLLPFFIFSQAAQHGLYLTFQKKTPFGVFRLWLCLEQCALFSRSAGRWNHGKTTILRSPVRCMVRTCRFRF